MNRAKKYIIIILAVMLMVSAFSSCAAPQSETKKLNIITTIFPQYDFARQIAGEYADISILLDPGIESHTYEPTPIDMKKISDADIFIYTGEQMEPWAQSIIDSIDNKNLIVVDASYGIDMIEEQEHGDEEHAYDPHIWLDPTYAETMTYNILAALVEADEPNSAYYVQNAQIYTQKLQKLDSDIKQAVDDSKHNTIVFAGRFAYAYFIKRYDIAYMSAYESCSTHDEPSVQSIISIVDFIKENDIKVIFHEELVDPKVATSIAEQTGAELAVFHTVHNISADDMAAGKTYIDIMYENLENLKKGLG